MSGNIEGDTERTPQIGKCVLPAHYAGGPKGLGDPEDRSIRKAELQFLVTDIVRKESKKLCDAELKDFVECSTKYGLRCIWKCRPQTNAYNDCMMKWKNDQDFFEQCKEQYLDKRSEYRKTGVGKDDIRDKVNRQERVNEAKEILKKLNEKSVYEQNVT